MFPVLVVSRRALFIFLSLGHAASADRTEIFSVHVRVIPIHARTCLVTYVQISVDEGHLFVELASLLDVLQEVDPDHVELCGEARRLVARTGTQLYQVPGGNEVTL